MDKAFIYTLSHPITNEIRYVGYTTKKIEKRVQEHIRQSHISITYKNNWINSLKLNNLIPIIEIIDEVPFNEWKFWETHYIFLFRSWGFNLTNSDFGGQGANIWTKERIQKASSSKKGKLFSEEHKKNISIALKGKKKTKEHLLNFSLSTKGKRKIFKLRRTKEHCQKIWESRRKSGKVRYIANQETRNKISIAHKGKKVSKESILKRLDTIRKNKLIKSEKQNVRD